MKTVLTALLTTLALASRDPAAASPSKCTAGEIEAAGKKAAAKAACWAKATKKGVAVDSTCLGNADAKFSTAYQKAQHKGDCINTTIASTIETTVDGFMDDLIMEVNGSTGTPTASKCSAKELVAAGKKAGAILKCDAKATAKGDSSIAGPCIATAQGKFGPAWTKATSAGDCSSMVDQATIENKVDDFATGVNTQLTASTCTATTCAAQGRSCGTIPDGCGHTLTCGTCPSGKCCRADGSCDLTNSGPSFFCLAPDGACASAPSANCPCCNAGICVTSCPAGNCCNVSTCIDTAANLVCRAADGTCASPPSADCPCCILGECVSSCPAGNCCNISTCVDTAAFLACRAADGTCAFPPSADCPCCNSYTCVDSCGPGQCCQFGTCNPPTTCAEQGATCGSIPDDCGGTLGCGTCTAPDTCGGGGTPNMCGCTDNGGACPGRVCGSAVNNCGQDVSCGTCPASTPTCCVTSCVCSTCQCP